MDALDRQLKNPWTDLLTLFVLLLLCTIGIQFFLLVAAWAFGKDLVDLMRTVSENTGEVNYFSYLVLASGSLGTFLLPAYFFYQRRTDVNFLTKDSLTGWRAYGGPVLFLFALAPIMNLIGEWNMQMALPDSLGGVEEWMRRQEDNMAQLTSQIVMTKRWDRLLLNIIVIGFLPAICEEFFFRGALQNIFKRIVKSEVAAIWLVGFIFSLIHFQFYGFFPRLLLGVIFGYAVLWTKNIWTAVLAHFVNNTTVVLLAFYFAQQGKGYDALMEVDTYPIIMYLGSFVFSAMIGFVFYQYIKKELYGKRLDKNSDLFK
ncbi:CPBP family intramembrane glutamic endopeptidase [Sphingobacterium griseoflavum]|uniref:CAAX prenyl protease 2/Lysostaphin resistance protein A-like domain-containing protein n=1 Tax=Sphingobacterium griseoflavum TaxID=1474952 RepID=A0ABQ3HS36_9SPHI|nr:CPBP family intramembrane glutamic endopeptidase [Sphingobacterium griseoflavum]GHE29511.1 hypothetical protein GCM10017764_10530 [Sphingobacterium griseoflavum]